MPISSGVRISVRPAKYKVSQEPRHSQIVDAGHLNGEFLFIPQA